jgi:hypothetical protein
MCEADAERSVDMSVTEYECELISAFREIRDDEVAQMIGELVHVLSITHMAEIIPITRNSEGLTVAGGREAPALAVSRDAVPIDLDLVDA